MKQVSKDAYAFENYGGGDRFASYAAQLREILSKRPSSVLEVGVGEGVVGDYLRRNTSVHYESVDIAADLHPDTLGDVRALPYADASFDTVCAFEVLEHVPFDDFSVAVAELARVARRSVLISLPHFGPPVKLLLKLPFLSELAFAFKLPYPKRHAFNGQHYWEIGKRGYPASRIRTVLAARLVITKEFVPFGNQYHRFFVCEKKQP